MTGGTVRMGEGIKFPPIFVEGLLCAVGLCCHFLSAALRRKFGNGWRHCAVSVFTQYLPGTALSEFKCVARIRPPRHPGQ